MALIEVLVAAAVLGLAAIAFLGVLREAGADASHARQHTQRSALALALLQEAKQDWRGARTGTRNEIAWRRTCAMAREPMGQRLVLVRCRVTMARAGAPAFEVESAFAVSSESARQP